MVLLTLYSDLQIQTRIKWSHLRQTVEDDGAALREGGAHPTPHCARPGAVVRLRSKSEAFSPDYLHSTQMMIMIDTDTISVFSLGHLSFFLSTSGMPSLWRVALEQLARQSCVISMLVKPTMQAMSGVGESGPAHTVITLLTGSLELAWTDGKCWTLGCRVMRPATTTIITRDTEESCTQNNSA